MDATPHLAALRPTPAGMSAIGAGRDGIDEGGNEEQPDTPGGLAESPTLITVCPDGPLLVRGSVRIVDTDGTAIPQTRPTIALCRCGKSRIAPLCDGTHKMSRSLARSADERRGDQNPSDPA